MLAKNVSDYNLWILSDGSFQMVVSQSLSIKDECEYVYGTWDNEAGCSSSYYDYYNYSPFQYCNEYYELDQYNFGTTNCSQDVTIEGTWAADETASTVTLTLNDFCENSQFSKKNQIIRFLQNPEMSATFLEDELEMRTSNVMRCCKCTIILLDLFHLLEHC